MSRGRAARAVGDRARSRALRRLRRRAPATPRSRRPPRTPTRRRPERCGSSPTATRSPTRCSIRSASRTPTSTSKTASFNSDKAAAAKLAGGFEADVVEVCADEMQPLLDPRPDPAARSEPGSPTSTNSTLSDSDEIRNEAGNVLFAPASAGPHGLIVNTDEVDPSQIDSYTDLFDPAVRGPGGDRVDAADRDRRSRAMALGMDDPMDLSPDQIDQVEGVPARPPRPVPRLRRVRRLDGQPLQVGRGGDRRRRPRDDRDDDQATASRRSGSRPRRASLSWVCGLGDHLRAPRTSTPPTSCINYYASPEAQAIGGESGFVA